MKNEISREKKDYPVMLPIRCILFLSFFLFVAAITKLPYPEISKWWTPIAIVCNLLTIALLGQFTHRKGTTYKKLLHYEKGKTTVPSALLIIAIILAVGMGGLCLAGWICYGAFPYLDPTMVQPIPFWLAILVLFLLPASTTLAEDGLYLGYAIHSGTGNKRGTALLSAFFYALQHSFIPFLPDGIFMLYRFLSFLPLTIVICVWYEKKRDPLPIMIGHFILNLATAGQIFLMTILPDLF